MRPRKMSPQDMVSSGCVYVFIETCRTGEYWRVKQQDCGSEEGVSGSNRRCLDGLSGHAGTAAPAHAHDIVWSASCGGEFLARLVLLRHGGAETHHVVRWYVSTSMRTSFAQ